MRWAAGALALVVTANAVVLISAQRERRVPVSRVTIDVCAAHLAGGGSTSQPPALRLLLAPDSLPLPPGLDSAGLRALGFAAHLATAMGHEADSTFRWPRPRPAWVRLRQTADSLARFSVARVAPRRELLAPDTTSIVIRARIWVRQRFGEPSEDGVRSRGVLYPTVVEIIPSELHLDRHQSAALTSALSGATGCAARRRVVIATGKRGGTWVDSVP